MAAIIDAAGATQQINLGPEVYRAAHDAELSVRQYVNQLYQTAPEAADAFTQLCASEGMFVRSDNKYGIRPATMDAILNGGSKVEAGVITRDANPVSRILFPAFVMSMIEDKLVADMSMTVNAFNGMVAVDDSIASEKFERPVLNFSKPEAARSMAVSQLSEPTSMLTITVSDKSQRITGTSIGMEIADQAVKATSLDLVTLAMTRQAQVELAERVDAYILAFLNGDTDLGMASLTTAGKVLTAAGLDSGVGANTISQKAWVKYLFNDAKKRRLDYVITDINGALAIEARSGRPNVQGDNPNSKRIDTVEDIVNPMWPDRVKVFITTDPNWPAKTILGLDSRYAIHRVTSTTLSYQAAEAYAIRRSTKFRVDTGQIAYRLFDDAWQVLTY